MKLNENFIGTIGLSLLEAGFEISKISIIFWDISVFLSIYRDILENIGH